MPDTVSAQIRVITSAKGGVGKSTVCANLGMALAMQGKRVLLIDCDAENRCLDLMLGLENDVIFGLSDVLDGRCKISRAILACPTMPHLFLLPGGCAKSGILPEGMKNNDSIRQFRGMLDILSDKKTEADAVDPHSALFRFDYIFIDTPGGAQDTLMMAAACADEALIVSSAQTTAIRSAEKTASFLTGAGLEAQRLIINEFMDGDCFFPHHAKQRSRRKKRQSDAVGMLFSVVDSVALPLLGVIPFDAAVWEAQNAGLLVNDAFYKNKPFAFAFYNIAERLCHRNIPLFSISSSYPRG
ncbi:MAG: P-loop NTPase [Eubacteriales bacterium]